MGNIDLSSLEISRGHLEKVLKNQRFNELIGSYYEQYILESDSNSDVLEKKLERLKDCNSFWSLDVYKKSKVKDFKKTNLCRDKFCNNCKKVKQASRMARFMPHIDKVKSDGYLLSQMVLTVPNVSGSDLKTMISVMFNAFSVLIDYLKLYKKIKGVDFDIGYVGAIRSLEVTYKDDSYHPHLHVLIAHSKPIGAKVHTNEYSYDRFNKEHLRLFSDFEILIQKVWYLLINDFLEVHNTPSKFEEVRINTRLGVYLTEKEIKPKRKRIVRSRLDKLSVGYSCMMDGFKEEDFIELFKYMTKGNGSEHKEENVIMSYDNFKVLYVALHGVRQIQGYGVFYNIKDDDSLMNEVEKLYELVIEELQKKEMPEAVVETVQAILGDRAFTLICKSKFYSYIKQLE